MANVRWYFSILAAIAAYAVILVAVDAAEIRLPSRRGAVLLEGEIESGDLEKLRRVILHDLGPAKIYLASPGRDLAEAMNIGRFVRALKLETIVPTDLPSDLRAKVAADHDLKDPKANFICASACFFVFVAGVYRRQDLPGSPLLGIHRPYLSENGLRALSGDQALAAASRTRATVENYLREMGVAAKYAEQMFSISKDEVRWISNEAFEADFEGFIPDLKDWIDVRCDKRTIVERKIWEQLKYKRSIEETPAERAIMDAILKKQPERIECEMKIQDDLALRAFLDALKERRDSIR